MWLLERHFLRHALHAMADRAPLTPPLMGYVYLTWRCNLSCTYCDDGAGVKYPDKRIDRELDLEEWLTLFRILRRDVDMLILTGGEPFCRPDLGEILRGIRESDYRMVCVLTNALNLNEHMDALDSIDLLMISLDTMCSRKGDRMLGRGGAHARILENIELARGLRRTGSFRMQLNICITPDNIPDAHDVIDYALKRDVGFAAVPELRGFYPAEGLRGNPEYEALIRRVIDLKRRGCDVAGSMLYNRGIRRFDRYECRPTLLARIRPNGDVIYPCNKRNTVGGNLLEHGDFAAALREGVRRHGPVPACDNRCHAGCYMDCSLLVQKPWWLLHEAFLWLFRKPFFPPVSRVERADYPFVRGSPRKTGAFAE